MTLQRNSGKQAANSWLCGRGFALSATALATLFCSAVGCGASKESADPNAAVEAAIEAAAEQPADPAAADSSSTPLTSTQPEAADRPNAADRPSSADLPSMAMDSSGVGAAGGEMRDDAAPSGLKPPANSTAGNASTATDESASAELKPPADVPQPADLSGDLPAYEMTNPLEEAAKKAFSAPEEMKRLGKDSNLWIDPTSKRLVVDGYIAINQGPLEMFACPVGTKEHESVVSVLAQAREIHAGLLAIGADSGTPVSFNPEYRPATGQRIAIWAMWRDEDGNIQKTKAQQWVKNLREDKPLEVDWVFAGSSFWKDPESGREYYQADSGDLVCVSNFTTAMMDLPVESSQTNASLVYVANTEKIPPQGTPVRLVFVPIPIPGEEPTPDAANPAEAPEDQLLAVQ